MLGLDGLLAEYEVGQINSGIQRLVSVKVRKISVRTSKYMILPRISYYLRTA